MSLFATRVGVVSLKKSIQEPSSTKFEFLYQTIGLNTGNLMFTNAIFRQIDAELEGIGFSFNPADINKNFDIIVLPAANWINATSDWTWLIDLLKKIDIPIVTIGIGLQADTMDASKVKVSESSYRLIKLLQSRSEIISCRGDFTRAWLHSVGIHNVLTTGCPSLYMKLEPQKSQYIDFDRPILQGTRYWATSDFIKDKGINRKMYSLAGRLDLPMIYQSEPEEIDYLVYAKNNEDQHAKKKISILAQLYGLTNQIEVEAYLSKMGKVFFDVDQWSHYVKANIGVIGTRLHGSIIALNSGKPARLISHDSRTQEVAEFSKIPTISESALDNCDENILRELLLDTDLSEFEENRRKAALSYSQFLTESHLRPKHSKILY